MASPHHSMHRPSTSATAAKTEAATSTSSAAEDADAPSLQQAKVVVASTRACPYCKAAKEALSKAGIQYATLIVSNSTELRQQVRDVTGSSTVPQVFVGGRSIGGSDALAAKLADGSFFQLLSDATAPALPQALLDVAQKAEAEAQAASERSKAATPPLQLVQLYNMMQDDRNGVLRSDTVIKGRRLRTFSGRQAVGWLLSQQPEGTTREAAAQLAQQLLQFNLISASPQEGSGACPDQQPFLDSNEAKYFLVSEAPKPAEGQALNTHFCWYGPARPATQVVLELRQLILDLYERHLSADGRAVSYKRLGTDPLFRRYIDATAELQRLDLTPLSNPELIATFINLYNALIVHGLVVLGSDMNTLQRIKFFANVKYNIGGAEYTADDIENGVLRGNRPAASNLWVLLGLPQFSKGQFPKADDPRRRKIVEVVDPRIHFALVCGAKSCPPIKLYTPENLDEGLGAAGEAFCASEVIVDKSNRTVTLSKIFKWYAIDFGSNQEQRLRWVSRFLQGSARADLDSMLGDGRGIKVQYKEYDWSLNSDD